MSSRRFIIGSLALTFIAADLAAVEFSRDIAPILVRECLACHNAEKAKGGYRAHTFSALLQAGKGKTLPVVPGNPDKSELFQRLVSQDPDDRMPQDDEPLTVSEIALVKEWITEGARLDRGDLQANLALLLPREPHPVPPEFYPRALPILALAFSRDGEKLAVGGFREVTIWDLKGHLQERITNTPARIHSISFDPTENRFAIAGGKPGRSGELTIYENGRFLTNLLRTADEFLAVAFSPNGKLLAGSGADNSIRVFRTENWEPVTVIQQHADWVTSISFNSDGTRLISASRDRTSRVYDPESGELHTTYVNHPSAVASAVFLSDELAASAGREKVIHFWDQNEGQKRNQISDAGGEIYELVASGEFLFSAAADNSIRQYSIKDRKLIRNYNEHSEAVFSLSYHPSTAKLAAGSFDGSVNIWDTRDGSLLARFTAAPLQKTARFDFPKSADSNH